MGLPVAHIDGIPIEETLGSLGPALLLVAGAASATLNAHVRHLRRGELIRRLTDNLRRGPGPVKLSPTDTSSAGEPGSEEGSDA
jgi:hypothetical protein